MKEELDKKLCSMFPGIFKERGLPMNQTCMCWGFECSDGWYDLIERACKQLDAVHKVTGIQTVATQVKEKFGTLRFYHRTESDKEVDNAEAWFNIIDDIVDHAEERSACACEVCGEYGELHVRGGWYITLCEKHGKEQNYTPAREIHNGPPAKLCVIASSEGMFLTDGEKKVKVQVAEDGTEEEKTARLVDLIASIIEKTEGG